MIRIFRGLAVAAGLLFLLVTACQFPAPMGENGHQPTEPDLSPSQTRPRGAPLVDRPVLVTARPYLAGTSGNTSEELKVAAEARNRLVARLKNNHTFRSILDKETPKDAQLSPETLILALDIRQEADRPKMFDSAVVAHTVTYEQYTVMGSTGNVYAKVTVFSELQSLSSGLVEASFMLGPQPAETDRLPVNRSNYQTKIREWADRCRGIGSSKPWFRKCGSTEFDMAGPAGEIRFF